MPRSIAGSASCVLELLQLWLHPHKPAHRRFA
jgi:hypothetical protein